LGFQVKELVDTTLGVYVHIPFCSSKCPYCDFNSAPARSIPEARYVGCLKAELARRRELDPRPVDGRRLSSVYLGGGTPTLFSPEAIQEIIVSVKRAFAPVADDPAPEVTIEANPESVDRGRLAAFKEAGANRVSIGVQSFDERTLKTLGRAHSSVGAREAVVGAREAGFGNIGIDLIFAVPGQSVRVWAETLDLAVELRPHHISLYNLTVERSTPFYERYGSSSVVAEETSIEMYEMAVRLLKGAGYIHYEISNFALPGYQSVHNTGYWSGRDYIGLGAGAHSYMSSPGWGRRLWNEPEPERYMRLTETGQRTCGQRACDHRTCDHRTCDAAAVSGVEELTRVEARSERVMLGLRMLERGIDIRELEGRFGAESTGATDLAERLLVLEREGLVRKRSGALLLTPRGALLSDTVIAALA
jgi:oxygen-independent coproporphyrinogen-3 oxidase